MLPLVLVMIFQIILPPAVIASRFSVGDEKKAGEKLQSVIRKEFDLLDEPDINQYINELGTKVLTVAGPQFFDYKFFIIDNREFNAFAAPSGLIFIHSGLITTMDSEDELLGVIAHEVAHVASRHLADRIDKSSKISIGTAALILAGIAMGGGELSEAVMAGAMATGASMNLKFSREHEEEADRLAFDWMVKIGRNPESILSMLSKMRRISILKVGKVPPYLLTHPAPDQRMGYVQDLLMIKNSTSKLPIADNFRFHRIKYRIIAETDQSGTLKTRLSRKLTSNDPEDFMARYGLSQILMKEGSIKQAREMLEEIKNKFAGQSIVLTDIALTYMAEGNFTKALDLLDHAARMDMDCAFTKFNLARVLDEKKRPKEAILLYEELLSMIPTYSRLHYHLGKNLTAAGKTGRGHYHTGVFNWLEGNGSNAIYHLKQAIDQLPPADQYHSKSKDLMIKIKKLQKSQ